MSGHWQVRRTDGLVTSMVWHACTDNCADCAEEQRIRDLTTLRYVPDPRWDRSENA